MNPDPPVVATMLLQLGLDLGRVANEVELGDARILLESHHRSAHDILRAEIATHGVQSDFHRSWILRRLGRESKTKSVTRPRSGPGGPCNNRRKNKRYAIGRCCRTADI